MKISESCKVVKLYMNFQLRSTRVLPKFSQIFSNLTLKAASCNRHDKCHLNPYYSSGPKPKRIKNRSSLSPSLHLTSYWMENSLGLRRLRHQIHSIINIFILFSRNFSWCLTLEALISNFNSNMNLRGKVRNLLSDESIGRNQCLLLSYQKTRQGSWWNG